MPENGTRFTFLPPSTLDTLKNVSFIARSLVEGGMLGLHRSPFRGFSSEFAEYRKYVPGDNVRYIDWKTCARSDRCYIKCFEEETNLRCHVLLDTSSSMAMTGEDHTPAKFHYACYLASAFLYLAYQQRDACTLGTWAAAPGPMDACSASLPHLLRQLQRIENLVPEGKSEGAYSLARLADQIPKRSLVLVFSDFLEKDLAFLKAFHQLTFRHCEVILFQILNSAETLFPYRGLIRFRDMETGEILEMEGEALRKLYLKRIGSHNAKIREFCEGHGIALETLVTSDPFEKALAAYFAKREGMA